MSSVWELFTFKKQIPDVLQRMFWYRKPLDLTSESDGVHLLETMLNDGRMDFLHQIDIAKIPDYWDQLHLTRYVYLLWKGYFWPSKVNKTNKLLLKEVVTMPVVADKHIEIIHRIQPIIQQYEFVLGGGTALAWGYLQHRVSEDLDFFTTHAVNVKDVYAEIYQLLSNDFQITANATFSSPNHQRFSIDEIKMDLVNRFYRLEPTGIILEGIPLLSQNDLAAEKMLALFERGATRDFVDVYFMDRDLVPFDQAVVLAMQKDSGFEEGWFLKSLERIHTIDHNEVQLLRPMDWNEMKEWYEIIIKAIQEKAEKQEQHDWGRER